MVFTAAACSGDDKPTSVIPTASASLSPAQQRLATLAGNAARASYDATYDFTEPTTKAGGTIRIATAPPSYRVDIRNTKTPTTTAVFITTPTGTVSCTLRDRAKPSCFLVARPGEEVPATFDPGVQRLFSDAVADLSEHPERYAVAPIAPSPARGAVPAAECFRVDLLQRPTTTPGGAGKPPGGFETGDYCLAEQGLLTSLRVTSGTLTLSRLGPKPTPAVFTPPVPPVSLPPLPSGSPSPS